MIRAKELEGFQIHAKDGEIGKLDDFLFDDEKRAVRFLVVNTGFWLFGRKVLISPHAVTDLNRVSGEIQVNLTREQVKNSPDIDAEMAVSRQHEMELLRYYNWPAYWGGLGLWRDQDRPQLYPIDHLSDNPSSPAPPLLTPEGGELNPHLRSVDELRGYKIDARGKVFGHIEDTVIDPKTWALRYFIVDTQSWWPSLPVAISLNWVTGFTWEDSQVHVELDRELIKTAPELKSGAPIDPDYEDQLHRHYRKRAA